MVIIGAILFLIGMKANETINLRIKVLNSRITDHFEFLGILNKSIQRNIDEIELIKGKLTNL